MRTLARIATAALVTFLTSAFIGVASYWLDPTLPRNSDNLRLIIRLSVPFALLLGVAAGTLPRRWVGLKRSPIAAVAIGAILAFSYTCIIARSHFLATFCFLIFMLSCWVPSGISTMLVTVAGRPLYAMTGGTALCLLVILLMAPTYNAFTHNQRLTVAFVTPSDVTTAQLEAHPETLGFDSGEETQTAKNEVLQRIRALGYREYFRVLSITREGEGKNSLAIIVIRTPVTKGIVLPEPDGSTVAYIQKSENWEMNPTQSPVLRRGIEIRPPWPTDGSLCSFAIPDASGVSLIGEITAKGPVRSR